MEMFNDDITGILLIISLLIYGPFNKLGIDSCVLKDLMGI